MVFCRLKNDETHKETKLFKSICGASGWYASLILTPPLALPPPPIPPFKAQGGITSRIANPFAVDGLQPALAARDQSIALLRFKLACAEEAHASTCRALSDALANHTGHHIGDVIGGSEATTTTTTNNNTMPLSVTGAGARPVPLTATDAPMSDTERRTINALVRRYLISRGYKASAVALSAEVMDQNLGPHADDSALLSLGRARAEPLSLLAMFRSRVAPLAAAAAEDAADRTRAEEASQGLRAELAACHDQLDVAVAELTAKRDRVAALETELLHARTTKGTVIASSTTSNNATSPTPTTSVITPPTPAMVSVAAPAPAAAASGGRSNTVSMAGAPVLLHAVSDSIPVLVRSVVTRQRAALVPLLAAAAGAEAAEGPRRALVARLLSLLRRPGAAERAVLRAQVSALAARLGGAVAETDILPLVILLAKTGKTRERRALAAGLAGALASHVSDKRADALLALLADLADARSAIVRVGVVDGLAALAGALSDRWSRSGAPRGSPSEAFSIRQYHAVEDLMWRVLLSGDSDSAERDATDLAAAAASEMPPALPVAYALTGAAAGSAAAMEAAAAASAAASAERIVAMKKPGGVAAVAAAISGAALPPPPPPLPALPASWAATPPSVAAAVAVSLLPAMVVWAHRLGLLWTTTLPGILSLLSETLGTVAPGEGASSGSVSATGTGTITHATHAVFPVPVVKLTEWHARRVKAVLTVLGAVGARIGECLLDESYSIVAAEVQAPPASGAATPSPASPGPTNSGDSLTSPASPAASTAAVAAAPGDYIYELFDFTSTASVNAFPSDVPLTASVRTGMIVYAAGATPHPSTAPALAVAHAARGAAVLNALLSGTAAVRRRRNAPVDMTAQGTTTTTAVWTPVRDDGVVFAWPALRIVVRSVVCGLLAQAAAIPRGSAAGRTIHDAYATSIGSLGASLGSAFTANVLRPLFARALGLNLNLPPTPVAASTTQSVAPGGRAPALTLFAHVLLGVPGNPADARRAAIAAASGILGPSDAPPNFASAGPRGADWPYVLPEVQWLARLAPTNPSNWGVVGGQRLAAAQAALTAAGPLPPPTAPGVPAAIAARLGGAWNADALLPLFSSSVLASPSLPPLALATSFKTLLLAVAGAKSGWGAPQQQLLEDAAVRASAGFENNTNNSTSVAAGGVGTGVVVVSGTAAVTSSPALTTLLTDVLALLAHEAEPATRLAVLGVLRALTPALSPALLSDPFLPLVCTMTHDTHAGVVRAAVRALAAVYSSGAAAEPAARDAVNAEVTALLAKGPKDVVLEILRALMRAIPHASPSLRDGYILDRLLEMAERVAGAAAAGANAMRELSVSLGGVDERDVHAAAATALRQTRAAAIEEHAPWPHATVEDLEETAMALCEALRAYGSVLLARDLKGMIRDAAAKLLRADLGLLEPSYRDVMRSSFSSLFPHEKHHGSGVGGSGNDHMNDNGGGDDSTHHTSSGTAADWSNVDASLAADFAAARAHGEESGGGGGGGGNSMGLGLPSPSWHPPAHGSENGGHGEGTSGLMTSFGSALKSGMRVAGGFSLKGSMNSMGMGGGGGGGGGGSGTHAAVAPSTPSKVIDTQQRSRADSGNAPTMSLSAFGAAVSSSEASSASLTSGAPRRLSMSKIVNNNNDAPQISMSSFMTSEVKPGQQQTIAAAAHPPAHPPTVVGGGGGVKSKESGWSMKGMVNAASAAAKKMGE